MTVKTARNISIVLNVIFLFLIFSFGVYQAIQEDLRSFEREEREIIMYECEKLVERQEFQLSELQAKYDSLTLTIN